MLSLRVYYDLNEVHPAVRVASLCATLYIETVLLKKRSHKSMFTA